MQAYNVINITLHLYAINIFDILINLFPSLMDHYIDYEHFDVNKVIFPTTTSAKPTMKKDINSRMKFLCNYVIGEDPEKILNRITFITYNIIRL